MAKKASRSSDRLALDPSVHRTIVREFTNLVESLSDEHFRVSYLNAEWLSKINDPASGVSAHERRSAAITKWLQTEQRNAKTNQRLLWDETTFRGLSSEKILMTAKRYVAETIGEEVPEEVWLHARFSGGASTSKSRLMGSPAQKFREKADITNRAKPYFELAKAELWQEIAPPVTSEVDGNILFTVPKNALIDRVACKEPDINMYLQLAVGGFIRKSLKLKGIDLNDQTINQRLAKEGSITGELATVDLSSASDSITYSFVWKLLPSAWFQMMDDIRSPNTIIDGVRHENEMFSSMGNGFTFELESLLFWALTRAVCYHAGVKGTISVYGDDIIAPSKCVPLLKDVFGFCGLLLNSKKSFWSGPFRESCGKHWYAGVDVTPFYIKQPIDHVARLIHFLNRLRAWCSVDGICDPRFWPFWQKWSKLVPSQLKGGRCTDRIDALVSACEPRLTLVKITRDRKKYHLGNYLSWHNQKMLAPDSVVTTMEEIPMEQYVVRRRKRNPDGFSSSGWDVSEVPWFPKELY